jgi:hypothetical protein
VPEDVIDECGILGSQCRGCKPVVMLAVDVAGDHAMIEGWLETTDMAAQAYIESTTLPAAHQPGVPPLHTRSKEPGVLFLEQLHRLVQTEVFAPL